MVGILKYQRSIVSSSQYDLGVCRIGDICNLVEDSYRIDPEMIPHIIEAVSPLENVLVKTMRDIGLLKKEETNDCNMPSTAQRIIDILNELKTLDEKITLLSTISKELTERTETASYQSNLHSHPDERN